MDQGETKYQNLVEIENNERKKELDLIFKGVFDQASALLRRQGNSQMNQKIQDLIDTCELLIYKIQIQIAKLSDTQDGFIKKYKTLADTYKSGLEEFKILLHILQNMENQKQEINQIKIVQKVQQNMAQAKNNQGAGIHQQNKQLISEIQFSEKRVQRMRAGVKLAQVLRESLKKKYQDVQRAKIQEIETIEKLEVEEQLNTTEEQLLVTLSDGFQKQKNKVDTMLKESYKQKNNNDLDFGKKYENKYLQNYFKERFKLANLFLGDELIKQFLKDNEKMVQNKMKDRSHPSQQVSTVEKTYIKDLDAKNFVSLDEMEGNSRALKKMLKINQEIKQELLDEDHRQNLEALNQFEIQQKQSYWDKVLSSDQTKKQPIQKRYTQSQNIQRPKPQIQKQTIKIKQPLVTSLKKKPIFYQAHPNFPLIKEAYGESQLPEQRIRQSAIQYEIFNQPDRQLTLEFDQQPKIRSPRTAQSLKSNFFPSQQSQSSQPFYNRQNYQEYKSLTTLWGDKWQNY